MASSVMVFQSARGVSSKNACPPSGVIGLRMARAMLYTEVAYNASAATTMKLTETGMNKRQTAGFTLVEILIVVAIIGLLAAMAIPAFAKARTNALNVRFINDLRIAANAFEMYAQFNGDFPGDKMPGEMPDGMDDYLVKMDWTGATSIGGKWDWDFEQYQFGGRAGVSVHQPNRSSVEMLEIDTAIDDGNLGTGAFRKRSNGFIYFVEP